MVMAGGLDRGRRRSGFEAEKTGWGGGSKYCQCEVRS